VDDDLAEGTCARCERAVDPSPDWPRAVQILVKPFGDLGWKTSLFVESRRPSRGNATDAS